MASHREGIRGPGPAQGGAIQDTTVSWDLAPSGPGQGQPLGHWAGTTWSLAHSHFLEPLLASLELECEAFKAQRYRWGQVWGPREALVPAGLLPPVAAAPLPALLPQVFRLPVQECLSYVACAQCLRSQDPYCGWCVVEGR